MYTAKRDTQFWNFEYIPICFRSLSNVMLASTGVDQVSGASWD